jgi:hypothetical protein
LSDKEDRVHETAQFECRYAMAAKEVRLLKCMEEMRASNTVEDDEYTLADRLVGEPAFTR